jgi:formylglycine-generating enzyme
MRKVTVFPLLIVLAVICLSLPAFSQAIGSATGSPGVTLVSLPGGTFLMGQSGVETVHRVTVSSFRMSAKEITNSQYAAYLNAALAAGEITADESSVVGAKGDYSGQPYIDLSGSQGSNNKCWISYSGKKFSVATGKDNWPVIYVSWYGAKAFAVKNGFDLPREAEWEYAARGGKGYDYGTVDGTISSAKAHYNSGEAGYPKNVASYPANPFGLYDLAGNVWEWCDDWSGSYSSSEQTDPAGPSFGSGRILRGGSWIFNAENCRSGVRGSYKPQSGNQDIGFRVVRR